MYLKLVLHYFCILIYVCIYKYPAPGYFGYYVVMAMFLWLMVINYDLWKRITLLQGRSSGMFRKYNIFVWSAAATLVAITWTIDMLRPEKDDNEEDLWRPGVGVYYCWMNSE